MLTTSFKDGEQAPFLLSYVAELELEIDRLRRRDQFLQHIAREYIEQTLGLCSDEPEPPNLSGRLASIEKACSHFREILYDVTEPPGYHPAFDQVVAIAIRPLIQQVFRWQQRISGAPKAVLRLDLDHEYIEWFPARFRNIVDNLIVHALRLRNDEKGEVRLGIELTTLATGYELRFTDNGSGAPASKWSGEDELFYRSASTRAAGLGGGLAVVRYMVEQCCGSVAVSSGESQGTSVVVTLPRYGLDDHLEA